MGLFALSNRISYPIRSTLAYVLPPLGRCCEPLLAIGQGCGARFTACLVVWMIGIIFRSALS